MKYTYVAGPGQFWQPEDKDVATVPSCAVTRAAGCRLRLVDGREIVDGVSGGGAVLHGYHPPQIVEAIRTQAEDLACGVPGALVYEPAARLTARLGARLGALAPEGLEHVQFCASGDAALAQALRLAVGYWQRRDAPLRRKFLAFSGGSRGEGPVCEAESAVRPCGPVATGYVRPLPTDAAQLSALEGFLASHGCELAGILVEPLVQGAGFLAFQHVDVMKRLRMLADTYGQLLIFDERFTGLGRLGAMFAATICETVPDLLLLGEGLTGGTLPLGALLTSHRLTEGLDAPHYGPLPAGQALACAAAHAALDLYEVEPRLYQAHEIGTKLAPALGRCLRRPHVVDVRVRGAVGVVELDAPIADPRALTRQWAEEGVFIRPFGPILPLTPALTINDADLCRLTDAIVAIVDDISLNACALRV